MKNHIRLLSMLLVAVLVTGCGGASKDTASAPMAMEEAATEEYFADEMTEAEMEEMATGSVAANSEISETAQVNRKLIRTFDMNIQTKEFDEVLSGIQSKVQELGGYIEQSSLDGGSAYYSNYNRYSNLTVRIPSDKLDQFIENVKESANVTYISESTEDVTLQYVDVESRKIALETERDRLLDLLEQATSVEELITIESRLSEVRYQLESYASRLRTLDNQVDYSTVHINIDEVDRETKVEPKTFWEEVTDEFGDSIYGIGRDVRNFAIWFLGSSPYIVLWAVVIAAVVVVLKILGRKKSMKKIFKGHQPESDENK